VTGVVRTRRRQDPEAGITLVELIVAGFISAVVLTIAAGMFVQITKLTANAQSTKDATGVAWTVMNELAGVVRQGTQVTTSSTVTEGAVIAGSTPNSLTIDANSNATVVSGQASIAPTRVTFAVNSAGYLTEQRIDGVLSSGYYGFTGSGTTRSVNGPILTTGTGTAALFVYYAGSTQVVPASGGLTADQASTVTAVALTVTVANTVSSGSDPVQLINTITMPNIAIVNGGS
jgi:Tfp pilus assembly protein PilW